MKRVVVLGSTGSVGRQTLDIVREHRERFEVVGLSAGANTDLLSQQIDEFAPRHFVVADDVAGERLLARHAHVRESCLGIGAEALCDLARQPADIVINALLGYAGLGPTLAALSAGTDVALSNKETLVAAGELVRRAADGTGARILPVDSEHSAILQCLRAGHRREVRRLILTASGGPFRTYSRVEMRGITRREALRHPTWSMGAKITVDSATLMNKGLEVIEAHWLFEIDYDRIDIVVHPESIVHSLVEFQDGSVIAQLGPPDMRLPIWYALHAPERPQANFAMLDLPSVGRLRFEALDHERFPCVGLAVGAGRRGGLLPAILNAANEVAVAAFLDERLGYLDIPDLIEAVLKEAGAPAPASLDHDSIRDADAWAREAATRYILQGCPTGEPPC